MKGRLLRVALLLFRSGMTALIYRVAWMRELRLIFGFSTAASAAVLDASRYARALEEMEPDVPWRRPILERRAQATRRRGIPPRPSRSASS